MKIGVENDKLGDFLVIALRFDTMLVVLVGGAEGDVDEIPPSKFTGSGLEIDTLASLSKNCMGNITVIRGILLLCSVYEPPDLLVKSATM